MPVVIQNHYASDDSGQYIWLRGNLHSHSTLSDGICPPQEVLDAYASRGYQFMALTDHDIFSDYSKLDGRGMILLPGNEVTAFGPHMLQIGGTQRIEPAGDRQIVSDQIGAAGGLAVMNHPNWTSSFDHCSLKLLQSMSGYIGMEIYNGLCIDHPGSGYAVDKWDQLLASGRIVWGFANDDSHAPVQYARGWNMVLVRKDQVSAAGIMAAIRAGRFYPSTGVRIDAIETNGAELRLVSKEAQSIEVYGEAGMRLAQCDGPEMRFNAAEVASYFIRAQCYGQGGRMAWTQPLRILGGDGERRIELEKHADSPDGPRSGMKALRVSQIPEMGSEAAARVWEEAPASEFAYEMRSGGTPPVRTAVRAVVSERELALRFECEEPLMDRIQPRIREDGNPSLWTDESLEIFLNTEEKGNNYFHILVNPLGASHFADARGLSKSLGRRLKVERGPRGWTVELRLDLATLAPGKNAGPGSRFGFHVCRNRPVAKRNYMWAWVGSNNHSPERFGSLTL